MPTFGNVDVVGVVLLLLTVVTSVSNSQSNYVCPKKFVAIGRKCYYFSKDALTWQDAFFKCESLNSTLAVITKSQQESHVRHYLNRRTEGKYERWLGGKFNERQTRWIWAKTGTPLTFHGFSRMNANDRTKWPWHCIIIDPSRQNKWGAKNCASETRYVCQRQAHKIKKFNKSKCNNSASGNLEKDACSKREVGIGAPAYLVKKTKKKIKPYQVTTFVCPSHMILVGRKCYFFSLDKVNWSDAYWSCRDNKTKLAVITGKMQDSILRGFLNENFMEKHERWIGGIFDWKQKKWKWAMSGQVIKYQHFAKGVLANNTHAQHCITMDPQLKHLWNSKNRLEEKHYICQAKSKSVMKYDKTLSVQEYRPDATVIIRFGGNDKSNEIEQSQSVGTVTTEASPAYNQSLVTDRYIYN